MTTTPDPLTGAPLPTAPPTPAQALAEQSALDVPVGPRYHAVYGVDKNGTAVCVCGRSMPDADIDAHVTSANAAGR